MTLAEIQALKCLAKDMGIQDSPDMRLFCEMSELGLGKSVKQSRKQMIELENSNRKQIIEIENRNTR